MKHQRMYFWKMKMHAKFKIRFFLVLFSLLMYTSFSQVFADGVAPGSLQQQTKNIKGKVTDSSGEGLIGVSIIQKGTEVGTVTDLDGSFSLNVSEKATLIISYIGYKAQTIEIGNQTSLAIVLEEELTTLDEIVVVGYGTKRKGGVTSAVTTIGSKDIERSTSTTTAGAIVGKMAGITYRQKSGAPGASANIQIRNLGTPLYVIDGIMTDEGSFNNLDINDIDNISILKDGAAAIYGVKAANGVVLVTTKSGKSGKAKVSFNSYLGWQKWTTYPELMDAYEYNYAQAMQKVNRGILKDPVEIAKTKAELEKWKAGIYNPETGEDYRGFDWKDAYVSDAAPQQYVNANISGGGENADYYVSLSHINQDAVFPDYNFNRTNLQANINMKVSKSFKIGYQMSGKIENSSGPSLPRIDAASGDYQLIRNSLFGLLPTYRPYANDNPLYLNYLEAHDSRNMAAFNKKDAGDYKNVWTTARNNFTMEYKTPLKGLTATGMFSYFYANNQQDRNEKGWQEFTYDSKEDAYILRFDKTEGGGTNMTRVRENINDITGQFLLAYDNTFGRLHHVSATGGFEFYQRDRNYLSIEQIPVDNPYVNLMTTSKNNKVNEIDDTNSTASFVFRTSYEFAQKYIIDFAGRYDGSWKFPKDKRWGFFPSVSGAWRISEESFMKNSSVSNWLSNVKLRASYGELGDDNLGNLYPDFAYLSGYTYKSGSANMPVDPFQTSGDNVNVIGTKVNPIPITNISWMTTSILDIGIDLGFFENKLQFEFDAFKRKREGIAALPNNIFFPLESGMKALPQNLNSDENLGIDGFVKWTDNIGNVKYYAGANFTLARQKNVKSYGEEFFNAIDKYWFSKNDRWANVVNGDAWMLDVIGVFQNQEQIDNYPVNIDGENNKNLLPGDLIFRDVNGDGIINDYDRRPLGYAASDWPWEVTSAQGNKNPLLTLGINLGFEWKGIDFASDFAGGFMNTYIPAWFTIWGTGTHHIANGYAYNSLNVWKHEDIFDPTSPWVAGEFPSLRGMDNPSTRMGNNFYNKNVKYLRLRNLVLGYTLPQRWTQKAYIQKLRFYFEGTNLFSFDNMKTYGIDPEVSGVQGADYPQHTVYTVGFNLTF